jgi:hypothetical protein
MENKTYHSVRLASQANRVLDFQMGNEEQNIIDFQFASILRMETGRK